MTRFASWLAFLLLAVSHDLSARTLKLYVAPNGNDAWSGRLTSPDRRAQAGPLRTVAAALEAARAARQAPAPPETIHVLLRGGTYELDRPITLIPADSGTKPSAPFVIAGYRGEKAVLSGGRRLTGWRRVRPDADLWEADVPEVKAGQWYFRSLFVDGVRQQRARTPNQGFFRIQGASPQDQPLKLRFRPGDIRTAWAADGDVEVIALLAWADVRMQIREVDEVNHVAILSGDPRPSNKENDARYYVENAADALDAAGEWYLDRRTGVVRYWAHAGVDPNRATVVAPRLEDLLILQGDLERKRPVQHVVLQGLEFAHTDWSLGPNGIADTQAAIAIQGDVRAEGAVDCRLEGCRFVNLAGYALELGRGCQRVRVVGNEMVDLGAGGVRLGETARRSESFQANHTHVVTDNHLHRLGRVYAPAVGVLILQSGTNLVAHNHIHDLYYTAVSVGWNWGYQETPCRANRIEFNHLHDVGQAQLSDMGAVYTLGIQKGTVIRNNLIHDVTSFTYGGWGLYTDEGSTDILLENNVVYRTKSAGFHQHYGRDNIVRNNILAFGREYQIMRTREEQHNSFTFERNLVYFDSGELLGSNWSNNRFVMDHNLYCDARPGASAATLKLKGASLAEWQKRGHDRNSIVADPRFVDPARADFRLARGSPARALGFVPIDVTEVGVRKAYRRQVGENR
jgi:hypothetical protein